MDPKMPRPAAPGRAHRATNLKELAGTFDPQISDETGELQEDSVVSIVQTRIVCGRGSSFIYIPHCPLCGLEHAHGLFPYPHGDPLQAYDACDEYRASHCHAQGLGRVARRVGGQLRIVQRKAPPEYHEPKGEFYRIVMSYPACFTPRGIRTEDARYAMAALARRGVATSLEILRPRRSFVLQRGD